MNLFKSKVKKCIEQVDLEGLDQLLRLTPELSNQGVTIPFDNLCRIKAHPLHRICDGVFAGKITDDQAVGLAEVFLAHGARIDGDKHIGEGTPLIAAASLSAEQVGVYYIDHGADIHYTYQDDGVTPLHWASFCGLDLLVQRLLQAGAGIDQTDNSYHSTPLNWALHSLQTKAPGQIRNQVKCISLLLKLGADTTLLSPEKNQYFRELCQTHTELQEYL